MIDSYVCLDLETTGLDPKKDKIIEIGAVRVRDGEIVAMLETFINPDRALDERIIELTGIVDEQLQDAPDIRDILPELLDFIGDDVLLGHSVLFDYSFVKRAAVNERLTFEKNGIDTLKLARKFLPDLESRSLEFLCRHFEIEHSAHRAIADAKATLVLYRKLAELFYDRHEEDFKPIPLKYNVKRDTLVTIPQKNQLYKLLDRHKLKVDYDVEKLTRSEASRIIAQLLAEYGR
ncbi:MAG: 3'-5' exonuclease [Lachnospiraceae bacterium]|nr:3'-5' exonuclease [Lachnospiraceae bacterium]